VGIKSSVTSSDKDLGCDINQLDVDTESSNSTNLMQIIFQTHLPWPFKLLHCNMSDSPGAVQQYEIVYSDCVKPDSNNLCVQNWKTTLHFDKKSLLF